MVDLWSRLNRFLILGVESGTYYVGEREHTLDNIAVIDACFDADPYRTIGTAIQVSDEGRAAKNDYAIWVFAKAAAHPNIGVRHYALARLGYVCRTGTHILMFASFVDQLRGWGPSLRKAVARWFLERTPDQLAYQVLKYQQRNGWSMRDLLRLSHPQTDDPGQNAVLAWVAQKPHNTLDEPKILYGFETAKKVHDPSQIAYLVRNFGLTREMVPSQFLADPTVLRALAEKSPYTALIRNLGNFTRAGLDLELGLDLVSKITNPNAISNSRIHPINLLTALRTYASGGGWRGSNNWSVNPAIERALEQAFYLSFANVPATNKRYYIGMDISGSMSRQINNTNLSARDVAAAIAMLLTRNEPWTKVVGFDRNPMDLTPGAEESLGAYITRTQCWGGGATDCAQPMLDALSKGLMVDTFIVITDNETWAGRINPDAVLRQ